VGEGWEAEGLVGEVAGVKVVLEEGAWEEAVREVREVVGRGVVEVGEEGLVEGGWVGQGEERGVVRVAQEEVVGMEVGMGVQVEAGRVVGVRGAEGWEEAVREVAGGWGEEGVEHHGWEVSGVDCSSMKLTNKTANPSKHI
jgi:hypothetical protein